MDEPVTIKRLAAASGQSADDVRAALVKFPQLEDDDEGRITGLFTRSPHWSVAFTFDGKTLFGCASDTLAFPVILGRAGVAEDTCPATGKLIRVELTSTAVHSVHPPRAVVSKVRPAEGLTDIPAEVCGLGHFFSSPEAAGGGPSSWGGSPQLLDPHPRGEAIRSIRNGSGSMTGA